MKALLWVLLLLTLAGDVKAAPGPGDRIDPFTLRDLSNRTYSWRAGRVTIITVCAFWCDTWKTQLPRVQEAHQSMRGMPVDFLTVSVDGRWTEKGKAASAGTMLSDPGGRWSSGLGIDRVPYTLVVDAKGTVTFASFGTLRSQELLDKIRGTLNGEPATGVVYLTFDDFPAKTGNEELLDVLRAEQVPATFFCICNKVSSFASLLKRTVREGHRLQIHSWDHDSDKPELSRCVQALDPFGEKPTLYRPPGSEKVIRVGGAALNAPVTDPYDFQRPGTKELLRRISLQVKAGSVIQLHAGVNETRAALPEIIRSLRARGFRFELLG
ncbi:MAG: hypothetical protein BGO01_13270 [Armatimonadetes bacterium 55-13]|nr:polysaccharide deacetylase family protein [Armatimonadota bacterium]ODU53303.1 MAG: hypothetical protein ABT09_01855 [bacterium SCN 57-13]OJU61880.1 MAG: hypothetical protein BGO01_13270 [Armatimonadetes bacterium 55-13]